MNNPYQASDALPYQPAGPAPAMGQRPAKLGLIATLCLLLGIAGFFGAASTLAVSGYQLFITIRANSPGNDSMLLVIPNLVISLTGIVVGLSLAIAGAGCYSNQRWAWLTLRMTLLCALAFVIVRQLTGFAVTFLSLQQSIQRFQSQMNDGMSPQSAANLMSVMIYSSLIFSVIWSVALGVFYVWSWRTLGRPEYRFYFGVPIPAIQ